MSIRKPHGVKGHLQQKCRSSLEKKNERNEPYNNMIFNSYLYHNESNSFINIYKTALIQVNKNHRKGCSMYHFLEAALNSMPQRSTLVRTPHKVEWHLGQANKLFEKKKTMTNEHQDMISSYSQVPCKLAN